MNNYAEEIVKTAIKYKNKGVYCGCGMYNFVFKGFPERIMCIRNNYEKNAILQVYADKNALYYGDIYLLVYYKPTEDFIDHNYYSFNHFTDEEQKYLMEMFKNEMEDLEDLGKFCTAKTLEEKVALINYWEDDRGADGEEFIADLTMDDDGNTRAFINLYGIKTYERCKKISRYWMCGNVFYANVEDEDGICSQKIWPVTEESVESLFYDTIYSAIRRFEDYGKGEYDDISLAIKDYNSYYGGLIDFDKYADEKGYTNVTYTQYAVSNCNMSEFEIYKTMRANLKNGIYNSAVEDEEDKK